MIRRNFLKTSGLLSLSPLVPGFVNQLAAAARPESDQRILVVIELSGGNDGLNTIVPFADEEYAKARPKLKLDPKQLHKLNDSLALNRSMSSAKAMFDAGDLAIVNGVGYPNPNRSHFESLKIWHRGLVGDKRDSGAGWIGHALDLSRDPKQITMDGYYVGNESVSAAMIGRRAQIAALSRFSDLQLDRTIKSTTQPKPTEDIAAFVQRQVTNSYKTARQIESAAKRNTATTGFPGSRLGQQMKLVSQLIKTGSAARVYYTVQNGYDTHSSQLNSHSQLLFDLSRSMKAFVDDMKESKLDDRVIVMAFSEFGRRVKENSSLGTDHGTAGPVFLAGTPIKSGMHGSGPDLSELVDGDLKTQFDFRQLYATVLDNWLQIDSTKVLNKKFEHLDLL